MAGVSLAALLVCLAWWMGAVGQVPAWGGGVVLLVLGCAVVLNRPAAWACPAWLRWDGHDWHWAGADHEPSGAVEHVTGRAAVCLDLGGFMLIRLVPHDMRAGGGWLPLSRRDALPDWHLLRCALHATPVSAQRARSQT